MEVLGWLPGYHSAEAAGVSADGSVVVGACSGSGMNRQALRWTAGGGMGALGYLPGANYSRALGISADGSTVVGESGNAGENEAFQWTVATGMVGLGDLAGGEFRSDARGVSADGRVVVGRASVEGRAKAFVWDAAHGMVGVEDLLTANGVTDVAGWQLAHANGISADGGTIVGWGISPSGVGEGWVAIIGPRVVSQPRSQIQCLGRPVSFSVSVSGAAPLVHQWFHDGVALSEGTNATLLISNVSSNDAGLYSLSVSNAHGVTGSAVVSLTVQPVCVNIRLYPGLMIGGITGQTYRVEYVEKLEATNNWLFLTNVTLLEPDQLWVDPDPVTGSMRYYRVLPAP
jgi:probable HAF family extracellular repeat protein